MSSHAPAGSSTKIACPFCRAGIPLRPGASGPEACDRCGRVFEATHFRPAAARARVHRVAAAGPAGATPCVFHEANAAEVACERCGSFICALCELEASADGKILCPACFDRLRDAGLLRSHLNRVPNDAGIAIAVALAGTCAGGLTGPIAVYYAARGLLRRDAPVETGSRAWLYVGVTLGLAEIAFGVLLVIGLYHVD